MRIVVAGARPPASTDPFEAQRDALVAGLRQRGHEVESVALPFRAGAPTVRDQVSAWRLLDLSTAGGRTIDLLIAAGFPAYFARHPRKVAWLFGEPDVPRDLATLDAAMRGECERVVTAPVYDPRLVDQLLG